MIAVIGIKCAMRMAIIYIINAVGMRCTRLTIDRRLGLSKIRSASDRQLWFRLRRTLVKDTTQPPCEVIADIIHLNLEGALFTHATNIVHTAACSTLTVSIRYWSHSRAACSLVSPLQSNKSDLQRFDDGDPGSHAIGASGLWPAYHGRPLKTAHGGWWRQCNLQRYKIMSRHLQSFILR